MLNAENGVTLWIASYARERVKKFAWRKVGYNMYNRHYDQIGLLI